MTCYSYDIGSLVNSRVIEHSLFLYIKFEDLFWFFTKLYDLNYSFIKKNMI